MKYLLIAAIVALVFFFIYRRLRPYIELVRKFTKLTNGILDQAATDTPQKTVSNNKLTRCSACGTWIPQVRAISMGSSFYCSNDCVEKLPSEESRRVAS